MEKMNAEVPDNILRRLPRCRWFATSGSSRNEDYEGTPWLLYSYRRVSSSDRIPRGCWARWAAPLWSISVHSTSSGTRSLLLFRIMVEADDDGNDEGNPPPPEAVFNEIAGKHSSSISEITNLLPLSSLPIPRDAFWRLVMELFLISGVFSTAITIQI